MIPISPARPKAEGVSLLPEPSFPSFPFPPYPIQLGFMREMYGCMESGGIGLLESPTGEISSHALLPCTSQTLRDLHASVHPSMLSL